MDFKKEDLDSKGGPNINPEKLVKFVGKWAPHLAPKNEVEPEEQYEDSSSHQWVLMFLKTLPFLCGCAFFVSIWWDINGTVHFPWSKDPISLQGMIRMLAVSGLIGFGTNWLAIKMLFYPRKRRPLLGQGLIPSRKDKIVSKLGESISREIINSDLILEQIRDSGLIKKHRERLTNNVRSILKKPEFRYDLMEMAEYYVNTFLQSPEVKTRIKDFVKGVDFEELAGLEGGLVKLYRMVKGDGDISERIQEVIDSIQFRADRYEDKLQSFLEGLPATIEEKGEVIEESVLGAIVFLIEQVNIRSVITENLKRFDEIRLERLLLNSTSDQLQYIQYLGAFLGIIGGLFIWRPLESTVFFGVLAGLIYGVDVLIMRLLKKFKPTKKT